MIEDLVRRGLHGIHLGLNGVLCDCRSLDPGGVESNQRLQHPSVHSHWTTDIPVLANPLSVDAVPPTRSVQLDEFGFSA